MLFAWPFQLYYRPIFSSLLALLFLKVELEYTFGHLRIFVIFVYVITHSTNEKIRCSIQKLKFSLSLRLICGLEDNFLLSFIRNKY